MLVVTTPFLFLADWDRSLLITVPFAVLVASAHPLAGNVWFCLLVSAGSLATTLGRPAYAVASPPREVLLGCIVCSVLLSGTILTLLLWRWISGRRVLPRPAPIAPNGISS